jgi:hypothetical protein
MVVDLALSLTGSQLIASVLLIVRFLSLDLPNLILYFLRRLTRTSALCFMTASADTLRGCKTGSKVIWLLYVHPIQFLFCRILFSSDRMRAYYIRSFRFACKSDQNLVRFLSLSIHIRRLGDACSRS